MATDRLKEGIDALQRGDRVGARAILEEVVGVEPQNETAWYYLAAAQDDPRLRRTYLERVLIINPNNQRARDVLQKLDEAEASVRSVQDQAAQSQGAASQSSGGVRPISSSPAASSSGLGAAASGGFSLPFTIPDAPAKVGIGEMFRDGLHLFLQGVAALQSKPGVFQEEVGQATWWRFWLLVGWCTLVGSAITAAGGLISGLFGLFSGRGLGFIIITLITFVISVPVTGVVYYGAAYASHWYAKEQQGSQQPLVRHAYAIVLYYAPATFISAALSAVLSIIGLGFVGSLIGLALSIYALYLVGLGFKGLHQFAQPNQEWITVIIYFVAFSVIVAIMGVIIGAMTAPFFVAAAFAR